MTRKARRKRLREQGKLARRAALRRPPGRPPSSPWLSVGALVATAALTTVEPAAASVLRARPPIEAALRAPAVGHLLQDAAVRAYDIPAGPLADVIRQFEPVAGIRVDFQLPSIGTLQSPGVRGRLTVHQALDALLTGTGVAFTLPSAGVALLELRGQTEAVEVTAAAPVAIVSSPKYMAPLREIPQTIEVIPRTLIEEQAATTLSEVLRNVPGITLQAGEGGGASSTAGDMFNLRGFNAANSIFVDGVRDDGLIARDVYNLEQVEVFMGPTGSDVGRGTAAGYVNMESKSPRLAAATSALFSYGNADQKRLTVDVNRSLSTGSDRWIDRSAVRLNGLWQDGGVPGRDVVTQERRAIAPSLALGLDTPTRVTLAAQFMRQDNVPDYGIPGAAWQDEPLAPTTVIAPREIPSSTYYGSVGYDYDNGTQDTYTARLEHDRDGSLRLRNQTRYNRTTREAVITTIQNVAAFNATSGLVTLARQGNERENRVVANQTTAVARFSTGSVSHASTVGVEYASEEQFAPTLGGLGTRPAVDAFAPNPHDPVAGYAPVRTGASTTGKTNTFGVFGFDTIELTPRWQVNGGIRLEHYDTTFRTLDPSGVTTVDLSGSDTIASGKAGVVFRATRTANVYVSVGTSVAPPGTANFTLSAQANNQNNPNVEPQESANYEVGAKADVAGGRLSLSAAAFRTENRNVIFTLDATTIPPLYNQNDSQRVDGFSLGATGRLAAGWDVFANFAYLDSSFESQGEANNGNQLTLTPNWATSVWTTYRLPMGLTVGGGIRATDKVFINAANTIHSPGYKLVDGLVEYDVNRNLTLRVNLTNLTNETYIRNVNNNGGRYNPGQPRSGTLTASVAF